MNWEPARADHAIDRAAIIITFHTPLDFETFDDVIVRLRPVIKQNHLTSRSDAAEPIEIPMPQDGSPIIAQINLNQQMLRRVAFSRHDNDKLVTDELSISAQRMILTTHRYKRWTDFLQILTDAIGAIADVTNFETNVKSLQLEYVDRFQSTKPDADHFEVISNMTPYLCKTASEKRYSLHNHSGWFDFEGDTIRSLTNVNIDVVEPEKAQIIEQPTRISLFTMRRIEALIGVIDRPRERIGSLHIYLKEVFRCIITDEAAVRVALAD